MTDLAVLELRGVSKSFAATQALRDMSLEILPGEIHAIVGENGAGKSTLIKIMTGVYQPDAGEILFDGQPITVRSTQEAQGAGIAAIYQEPMVFPDLNVAENIFISNRTKGAFMRWSEMYQEAEALIAQLGVSLDVRRAASGLTLAEQQTVEIARALSLSVKVLIMDEPTASLSAHEVARLMAITRALKDRGVAVIYISHRLDEIFRIADRVTVIRDGQHISTRTISEVTEDGLVHDMVGRALESFAVKTDANPHGEVLLSVKGLGRAGVFQGVGFDLARGEVLCLAGLVGARRTDVALALFGIAPATDGQITLDGQQVSIRTPRLAMDLGIAYVSEDRRKLGLAMTLPIFANISLASLRKLLGAFGLIDRKAEIAMAERYRQQLAIRAADTGVEVGKLSGGNQQKVMLAKWLETRPRILIFDEPTRGIDVGAKAEVHNIIRRLAAEGVAVLVISSDLPEVLALADRVLVMREGRQAGILPIEGASQQRVISLAAGQAEKDGSVTQAFGHWSPQTLRLIALALALLATVLFFSTQIDGYLSARMFNRISTSVAVVLPVAVGQAIVVMTRNIDLSVGSILGVVAYVTGQSLGLMPDLHPVLVLAMAMGIGALAGAVNGVLVAWGRVPSIIVTLGTLALFRTFLVEYSDAKTITTASLPKWLVDLPQVTVFSVAGLDVRVTAILAVVACAVVGLALARLRWARRFYAVGSNPDAAVMAGINAARVVFVAFVISGALAGLSGFIFLAKFGNITVVAGMGFELKSVAAVVVGGVSIMGGSGSMLGVLMGALLVDTIDNSLTRWDLVSEFWRDALLGFLIMAAVTVDTFASRSLARLRAKGGQA